MKPEDRAAWFVQARLERQEWARSLDPEAYDAYWTEHAKQVNSATRIQP